MSIFQKIQSLPDEVVKYIGEYVPMKMARLKERYENILGEQEHYTKRSQADWLEYIRENGARLGWKETTKCFIRTGCRIKHHNTGSRFKKHNQEQMCGLISIVKYELDKKAQTYLGKIRREYRLLSGNYERPKRAGLILEDINGYSISKGLQNDDGTMFYYWVVQ